MPFGSLWLPVVASAVAVFVASSIAWMVLPHHRSDYKKLPNEEPVLGMVRGGLSAGMYMVPGCSPEDRKSPEAQAKMKAGPMGILVVSPGPPSMARSLSLWLLYCLLVSFFAAYVARHALTPDAAAADVMRLTTTVSAAAYVLANMPGAIWHGHAWSHVAKVMGDGLAYSLITGAIFTALW
jgi:hypothetical protein